MAYSPTQITTFVATAKNELSDLMYEIMGKEKLGENVEKKYIQARVLSGSILAMEGYNDYTLDEESRLADLYSNYDELTKGC